MTVRRTLIVTLIVLVAAIVAAAAFWWFFVREDNSLATNAPAIPADLVVSGTPTAGASAGTTPVAGTTPAASSDGALTFTIIPDRSQAAYFAGETLASVGLPSTAKGTTTDISGAFHLLPDGTLDPSQTTRFTVDLRTLRSNESKRDDKVQDIALQTSTFPTATFTAKSVSGWDPSIAAGQEQTLQLSGTLDLHGVQKDVTWDVKARKDGQVITALATLNFKYADFNIPILNIGGFVAVQDNVTLQVQVVAQQS